MSDRSRFIPPNAHMTAPLHIPHIAFAIANHAPGAIDFANTHFVDHVPDRDVGAVHPDKDVTETDAIGDYYRADLPYRGLDAAIFAGATGALAALAVCAGGRIAVESFGFEPVRRIARTLAGATPFDREQALADPAACAAALPPDVTQLWWTNPHNPTGVRTPDGPLHTLAYHLGERGILLVINEIYRDYVDSSGPEPSTALGHPNVAVVSSLTKVYHRGDLRFGWVAGPPAIIAAARTTRFVTSGPPPHAALENALAVLLAAPGLRAVARGACRERVVRLRRALADTRSSLDPFDAPFGLLRLGDVDDVAVATELRDGFGVTVAPGTFLDAPGCVRVSVGASGSRFDEGVERLRSGLIALL